MHRRGHRHAATRYAVKLVYACMHRPISKLAQAHGMQGHAVTVIMTASVQARADILHGSPASDSKACECMCEITAFCEARSQHVYLAPPPYVHEWRTPNVHERKNFDSLRQPLYADIPSKAKKRGDRSARWMDRCAGWGLPKQRCPQFGSQASIDGCSAQRPRHEGTPLSSAKEEEKQDLKKWRVAKFGLSTSCPSLSPLVAQTSAISSAKTVGFGGISLVLNTAPVRRKQSRSGREWELIRSQHDLIRSQHT
eukprot:6209119-Pleurochrysis_carterae.AAC.3